MPLFRYTATSPDGSRSEAEAYAETWQEIDRNLRGRGYKLTGIAEVIGGIADPLPTAAPPANRLDPVPPARAVPIATASPGPTVSAKAAPLRLDPVKTRAAKDKELHFLFSQLASYFRAGVNPAQAFSNLSQSQAHTKFQPAMAACAQAATQGRSAADAMAAFPYLFPPHTVGMIRAAEAGGFLPEACEALAEQAIQSHRFRRIYAWLGFFGASFVASWPAAIWGARSILGFWDRAEATGGDVAAPVQEMGRSFGDQFLAMLPSVAATAAAIVVACFAWQSMPLRPLRHRLVLWVPATCKRARLESLALFAWALSNLFRTGMSPKSAATLAAGAMPNLELADRMKSAAEAMRPETKLSEVADQVALLDPQMRAMVATGEYVGDLPGALQNVANAHRDEFTHSDKASRIRVGCWMAMIVVLGTFVLSAYFFRLFYDGVFQRLGVE